MRTDKLRRRERQQEDEARYGLAQLTEGGASASGVNASAARTSTAHGEDGGPRGREGEYGREPRGHVCVGGRADEEEESRRQEEAGAEEEVRTRTRRISQLPSKAAQEAHCKTHIPYRNWCRACVAGRKPNHPHLSRQGPRQTGGVPEVHLDYCFLRNSEGEEAVPTLVLRDWESRAMAAHLVPLKGANSKLGVGPDH